MKDDAKLTAWTVELPRTSIIENEETKKDICLEYQRKSGLVTNFLRMTEFRELQLGSVNYRNGKISIFGTKNMCAKFKAYLAEKNLGIMTRDEEEVHS